MENEIENTTTEQASPVETTTIMSKTKTDVYTCPVTGHQKKTNGKQLQSFANKFGLTLEEAFTSMVSQEGRRQIKEEKLTADQVNLKYGIHMNVANALRCVVKPRKLRASKIDTTSPVNSAPATSIVVEAVNNQNTTDNMADEAVFVADEEIIQSV